MLIHLLTVFGLILQRSLRQPHAHFKLVVCNLLVLVLVTAVVEAREVCVVLGGDDVVWVLHLLSWVLLVLLLAIRALMDTTRAHVAVRRGQHACF